MISEVDHYRSGWNRTRAGRMQCLHGAASDVNSVANCTENAMNGGKC